MAFRKRNKQTRQEREEIQARADAVSEVQLWLEHKIHHRTMLRIMQTNNRSVPIWLLPGVPGRHHGRRGVIIYRLYSRHGEIDPIATYIGLRPSTGELLVTDNAHDWSNPAATYTVARVLERRYM